MNPKKQVEITRGRDGIEQRRRSDTREMRSFQVKKKKRAKTQETVAHSGKLQMTRMMYAMYAGQWWKMGLELRAHQEGFGSCNKSANKTGISELQIV